MSFTPRERVLAAANHEIPDRVPLSLWGSWYGVTDRLYFNVIDALGWQPVPPFRPDLAHSVNYYDDRLLARLHVDVRHVDPGATAASSRIGPDGADGFGLKWDTSGLYRTASFHSLANATAEEIADFPMPTADDAIDVGAIEVRLRAIRALDQEYAIIGRAVASYGFYEMSQSLRRHERLFLDLVKAPDVVDALSERLFACYADLTLRFLDVAGPHLDFIELPGDDFAGNAGPIISPRMFDRFYKEPYRRFIRLIKDHSPHLKVIYHSDGAITPFLARFIDMGVDVVHPLEPLPATDMAAVKAQFGADVAFMGGIDIREALQGAEERVVEEVVRRIEQLAGGGGYILAPANHLQWDIPPRNLLALYDTAVAYGRYSA